MADHTYNVIKTIYDALIGETNVTDLVPAASIFSGAVDPDTSYPYIVISRVESEPWDTKDVEGQTFFVQINFYSRAGGIVEGVNIREAIYETLHRQTGITVPSGTVLIDIVHDTLSALELQTDGVTFEGVLRFKLTVQAS